MSTSEKQKAVKLFENFSASNRTEWTEKATTDLKGVDIKKKLQWNTIEGISIEPMYFRDDMQEIAHLGSFPGRAPFLRGNSPLGNTIHNWSIAQILDATTEEELVTQINNGVEGGQTAIGLRFEEKLLSTQNYASVKRTLEHIPQQTALDVYAGMSTPVLMAMFQAAGRVPGHSEFDPIAELTQHGSLPFSLTISTRLMADSIRSLNKETPGSVIGVSGEVYHNAGASAVEELACVLATAVEYVSRLQEAGLNVDDITSRMRFTFPVGTRFFMEVAKLRAARLLWARVVKLFGAKDEDSMKMRMHVRTSWWNQTTKDPYVNMLRATVENMAGAIGGANSMHTAPFDEVSGSPGQISLRNARNIQVVLQEEAHLSQVGDPAAGSYYVEQLTDAVARKSWEFFQEIERHGGALKALQEGFIQEKIKKTAAARKERISMRKDIIVGTNQYPNLTEKPLVGPVDDPEGVRKTAMDALQRYLHERGDITETVNTLQKSVEDPTENLIVAVRNAAKSGILASEVADILRNVSADSIQVAPLTQFRASEHFEKLRMAVETADKRPRVFLATLGPVFWRRARATFASGFFGTAGMDIKDNIGFDTIDAAAEAAVEDGADIIVACSDDESYREMVPELLKALRTRHSDMLVVVAGSPVEDIEMLTRAGVHSFIHVRSDVSVELAGILTTLGIDIQ